MAELIFKRDFPDVLRAKFQNYFEKFDCIMPRWMNTITIHYEPQPPDYEAIMEVMARTEYRSVDIVVYSDFLLINNDDREARAFLHEFCHVFYAQLHRQALCLAELLPSDEAQSLAFEGIRMSNEAATEDLAYLLGNIFLNKKAVAESKLSIYNDAEGFLATPSNQKTILNNLTKKLPNVVGKSTQTAQSPAAKVATKPKKKKV